MNYNMLLFILFSERKAVVFYMPDCHLLSFDDQKKLLFQ